MTDDGQDRLTRLEMRLMEQEAVIEDLNAGMTAQWRTIDALKRQVQKLTEQVEEAPGAAVGAPDRPPPHY